MRRAPAAAGLLALLAGLWGGLARLGWVTSPFAVRTANEHGLLMTLGFLGTLIALERAVALGHRWTFTGPVASAMGAVLLLAGQRRIAGAAFALAGVTLTAIFVVILHAQPTFHTGVLTSGALASIGAGALVAAGRSVPAMVPWVAAFLVLTIAGERLELARLARPSRAGRALFTTIVAVLLSGVAASAFTYPIGVRVAGAGLAALAVWFARYDIARRTIRAPGLPRFAAVCLLTGYLWLAAGGVVWTWAALRPGYPYDAGIHTVLLGFVVSMVFGHAPIIVPATLGAAVPFRRRFYVHLALLHASLILRIAGDVTASASLRRWGGLLAVVALLTFLASTFIAHLQASNQENDRV